MLEREALDSLYFEALAAEEAGEVSKAFGLFLQGANLGDDAAQNAVGLAYDSGSGVGKDKREAIVWFKKAWRSGKQTNYAPNIALTYAEIGNRRQAICWWKKAIASGDGEASLGYAKFLLASNARRVSKQIISLLTVAANSQEYLQITPAGREEAQELLKALSV